MKITTVDDRQSFPKLPKARSTIVEITQQQSQKNKKAIIQAKLKLEEEEFQIPPLDLLQALAAKDKIKSLSHNSLNQNSKLLTRVLEDFGIKGNITRIRPGPVVTLYEFEPAAGTKSSRVIGLFR